jgi:plasmid maintenance system antidote protein VapI
VLVWREVEPIIFVRSSGLNARMSDERMIRLHNLKSILKQRSLKKADLATLMDVSDTYAGRIINGKDVFTEKTARKLEAVLGLPHKWLDEIHTSEDANSTPDNQSPDDQSHEYSDVVKGGEKPYEVNDTKASPYVTNLRSAPVIFWGRMGDELLRANTEWPANHMRDLPATSSTSDLVKWVVMAEDQPVSGIRTGDMVAIDPYRPLDSIKRNQVGLFKSDFGEFLLRRFNPLPKADGNLRFEVFDDEGRVLDNIRHGLVLVGVCVGRYTERFD